MDKQVATLQLRDIHLPEDPGFWPLAPGWWILIILLLISGFYVVKYLIKYIKVVKKRKKQLIILQSELIDIRHKYKKHKNKHKLAIQVSSLLNRFVKYVLNDTNATSLNGSQWIDYLNSRIVSQSGGIFDNFSVELTQAQYQKNIDFDVPRLIATIKNYFPQALKDSKKYHKNKTRNSHA